MKYIKNFRFWLEIMECTILIALLAVFIKFHILCTDAKCGEQINIQKEELYRKIYNDQRIAGLQCQNDRLLDSIKCLNEEMGCEIKYIVVKDTVYICDTIYLNKRK